MKPVSVNPYNIKLRNADGGNILRWPKVNQHFVDAFEPVFKELSEMPGVSAISIYTRGIAYYPGRLMRGSSTKTSVHSMGLLSTGYKHWIDGSEGALGFDITKIAIRYKSGLLFTLTVTDPDQRKAMIKFCKDRGLRIWHDLPLDDHDHIHAEPWNLKGITS